MDAKNHCGTELDTGRKRWEGYERYIGTTLDDRYKVLGILGQGGMGVVYRCRHTVIERDLAIKVLPAEIAGERNTVERFVREAKAASRVGHPNIVEVTDFGTTPDGLPYFVMEYVEGQTLTYAIREQSPMPLSRVRRIGIQLADALEAAHSLGVAHRDLKPDNVFLVDKPGEPDFVKIVDFGIAKITDVYSEQLRKLTRAGSVFGTPEYMSPEQASGRTDVDHRADIYALGIILYYMVTGKKPFVGDNPQQTIAMQIMDEPAVPDTTADGQPVSPNLQRCIMTALAKHRDHRYPTMKSLAQDLGRAIAPLERRKYGDETRLVSESDLGAPKERRILLPILAIALIAALGVLAYTQLAGSSADENAAVEDPPDAEIMRSVMVTTLSDAELSTEDGQSGIGVLKLDVGATPVEVTCHHPKYHVDGAVKLTSDGPANIHCEPTCIKGIKHPPGFNCPTD